MPRTHPLPITAPPEPRPIGSIALFAPLVVIVGALLLSGRHSVVQWVLVAIAFLGIPLAILVMRRRAARISTMRPPDERRLD